METTIYDDRVREPMTRQHNLKNIRALLEKLKTEELRCFCYDKSGFRPVYDKLAQDTGKATIIDWLLEDTEQKLQIEVLLTWVRECHPAVYEEHQPYNDVAIRSSGSGGVSGKPQRVEADPSVEVLISTDLIKALKEKRCVLFVGPKVSTGPGGLPTEAELIRRLAGESRLCKCQHLGGANECKGLECCCHLSFQRLAQYYLLKQDNRVLLIDFLTKIIKAADKPLSTHRAIARLHDSFSTIVTTNYDQLLEMALEEIGVKYVAVVKDEDLSDVRNRLMLVKLQGCISRPDTILITEDESIDLFAERPLIASKLRGYLVDETILFLGYNLQANTFRNLYSDIRHDLVKHKIPVFAVQSLPPELEVKYWAKDKRGVKTIDNDALTFLTQVEKILSFDTDDLHLQLEKALEAFQRNNALIEKNDLEHIKEQLSVPGDRITLKSAERELLVRSAMHWYTQSEILSWLGLISGTEALKMAKELLISGNSLEQENAAVLAREQKLEGAVPELIQALNSQYSSVCETVSRTLAEIGSSTVAMLLLKELSKGEYEAAIVLKTLSSLPDNIAISVFETHFYQMTVAEQKTFLRHLDEAQRRLSDKKSRETIVQCISVALRSTDNDIFHMALELLEEARLEIAANYLKELAFSKELSQDRRSEAIRSLGHHRTQQILQILEKFLNEDEAWMRENAIRALRDIISLRRGLTPEDEQVRRVAVTILIETGDVSPGTRMLLQELTSDYDDLIREQVVQNLANFFAPKEKLHVVRNILSLSRRQTPEDNKVRRMAVDILVEDKSPETLALLQKLVKDPDDQIRGKILQSLDGFSDIDSVLCILRDILSSPRRSTSEDEQVRQTATTLLLMKGDRSPETLTLLQELTGDKNEQIRLQIIQDLSRFFEASRLYSILDEIILTTPENDRPRQVATEMRAKILEERYTSAILAIQNDERNPVGTSFLVSFHDEPYVVTCAHVIKNIDKVEGQTVKLQPFSSQVDKLEAEVLWFRVPEDNEQNWSAYQDIAILRINSSLPVNVELLPLETPLNYQGKKGHLCFGYDQTKGARGDWIEGISCEKRIAQDFIKLVQSEKTKIGKGDSGAPLTDDQGKVIGMIQAVYEAQAYLIPSKIILDVLSALVVKVLSV